MELKYFRLIKSIVEEGNMANSAEHLFLTQSALSHQLREMEDRLGFKVFNRGRNKWQLTKEGEELYSIANKLFETIDEGFSNIRQIKDGAKGSLKVSAECQSFFHDLPAFVQKMGILYPEISIDLTIGGTHQTISQLLSNELDVAIVTTEPVSELLYATKVFEDEIKVVMHHEHQLSEVDYLDVSDFSDLHLFINCFPLENVSVYEHFLKPNRMVPTKVSAIPYTEVTLQLIGANMGVTCVPEWNLKPFNLSDEFVFKRIGKNGLKRSHYLVMREADRKLEYFANFTSNFVEDFGNLD